MAGEIGAFDVGNRHSKQFIDIVGEICWVRLVHFEELLHIMGMSSSWRYFAARWLIILFLLLLILSVTTNTSLTERAHDSGKVGKSGSVTNIICGVGRFRVGPR